MEIMRTLFVLTNILFLINYTCGAIVNWGEPCQFTAECGDHRLVCEELTARNITTRICVCDSFHEWNGTLVGCVQKYNTEEILAKLTEKYNIASRIEYEANIVFLAQIVAGLIVLGIGSVCAMIVIGYCYRMWKQDSKLDDIVRKLEAQKENNKASTSRRTR